MRGDIARDAKQRAKGVEGVEAAVEAERELIEVRLQMLRADAVMDTAQPDFEIGEHEVDDGQKSFGDLHIATFRDSGVEIVALDKAGVAAPVAGDNGGAWRHGAFDETPEDLALLSGTRTSLTRPAYRPLFRLLGLPVCRVSGG